MRHRTITTKLGRSTAHRKMMLSNLVCSLIEKKRVVTTITKAKLARQLGEKMVTLGKDGSLAARRRAVSILHQKPAVKALFDEIAPQCNDRNGGYIRIVKRGKRRSDCSEMAIVEWVTLQAPVKKKRKPKEEKAAE